MDNESRRDPLNTAIAAELSHAQLDAKMTNVALAEQTGIKEQSLGRYLRGERPMPAGAFVQIVTALGADPGEIIAAARKRLGE